MTERDREIQIVSEILNESKIFSIIGDALGYAINHDDEFFYDIEEAIVNNFRRMDNEKEKGYP